MLACLSFVCFVKNMEPKEPAQRKNLDKVPIDEENIFTVTKTKHK